MVDESRFRYRRDNELSGDARASQPDRSSAAAPRGEPSASRADDALAELARLIGDEDPFADFGDLHKPEPEPARARPRGEAAPMPQFSAPPVERRFDDWQPGRRGSREAPPAEAPVPPQGGYARPGGSAPQAASQSGYPAPQARAPRAPSNGAAPAAPAEDWTDQGRGHVRSGYGSLARRPEREAPDEPAYEADDPYAAPLPRGQVGGRAYGERAPGDRTQVGQHGGHPADADADAAYAYGAPAQGQQQYDDYDEAYDPAYSDDGYMPPHDDELYEGEPRRRRSRMLLLVAASVVGVLVAGVAGVFAYRMALGPAAQQASGDQPPVIKAGSAPVKTAATPAAPQGGSDGSKQIYDRVGAVPTGNERVVSREEQPVDVNTAAAAAAAAPLAALPGGAPASAEPKRVKTLTVRADGSVVPSATPAVAAAAPQPTNGAPAAAPIAYTPPPSAAPVPAAPPSTATASTGPTPSANGTFVVQVSSQKSETDAMGSWKVLQSRYPNLLSGYKATVKKADLGDRGVFYRAQVGPFATRDQANELCQALKAQGGECLVQKN